MRALPAEERLDPDDPALPVESLEVVGDDEEVRLGREPVGRMAPVAVGERPELAGLDNGREPVDDALEVRGARLRPLAHRQGEGRGRRGVGTQRGHRVDPIERVPMIEPHDVGLDVPRSGEEVADQPGVRGDGHAEGVLHGAHGGEGVDPGAHAADSLGEEPGVAGIAAAEDELHPAEHRPGAPRVAHDAVRDLDLDAQVPADPGDGIDHGPGHLSPPRGPGSRQGRRVDGVDGNGRVGAADGDHVHAVERAGLVRLSQLGGLGRIRRDRRDRLLDRVGIAAGRSCCGRAPSAAAARASRRSCAPTRRCRT